MQRVWIRWFAPTALNMPHESFADTLGVPIGRTAYPTAAPAGFFFTGTAPLARNASISPALNPSC
jgi:hypothetical protein